MSVAPFRDAIECGVGRGWGMGALFDDDKGVRGENAGLGEVFQAFGHSVIGALLNHVRRIDKDDIDAFLRDGRVPEPLHGIGVKEGATGKDIGGQKCFAVAFEQAKNAGIFFDPDDGFCASAPSFDSDGACSGVKI